MNGNEKKRADTEASTDRAIAENALDDSGFDTYMTRRTGELYEKGREYGNSISQHEKNQKK